LFRADSYSELFRGFQLALEVTGLRPSAIKHYTTDGRKFLEYYPDVSPPEITSIHIRQYLAQLKKKVSAKTVYEVQLALRKFFRFLVEEGEIAGSPCDGIKLTRYRIDPQPLYSMDEIKALLASCDLKTPSGVRDYAIIMVLFDSGVRVGELISMSPPDWKNRLVKVDGKTGVRYVPLGLSSLQALERYLRKWSVSDSPMWRGKYGPLTTSSVLQMVRRRCSSFGIPYKVVHAFRRSAAAQLKRMGMNDSVRIIIGQFENSRISRRVSIPSMPRITGSRTTRSVICSWNNRSPSNPLWAVSTVYPHLEIANSASSKNSGSPMRSTNGCDSAVIRHLHDCSIPYQGWLMLIPLEFLRFWNRSTYQSSALIPLIFSVPLMVTLEND